MNSEKYVSVEHGQDFFDRFQNGENLIIKHKDDYGVITSVVPYGDPHGNSYFTLRMEIIKSEVVELGRWGGIFPATAHLAGKVEYGRTPEFKPEEYIDLNGIPDYHGN